MKKRGCYTKFLSLIMVMIMLITLVPEEVIKESILADEISSGEDNSQDEEGNTNDTEEDVVSEPWDGTSIQTPELFGYEYRIDSAEELAWFATEVNNNNTFDGKSIYITGDIDLNGQDWIVIGNTKHDNPCEIKGNIVIMDAVISGLTIPSSGPTNKGLFGSVRVSDVIIDNLTILDADIKESGENYDGVLFGSIEITRGGICEIKNSNVSGVIGGKSHCGALAGYVSGVYDNATLSVTNCDFKIKSTGYGTWWNGAKDNSSVKGGLIGRHYASANNNLLILNGVLCNDNLASYKEYGYGSCTAGGMIGELEGKANVLVYQCAVKGNIISSGDTGYAGGIIGKMVSCNIYRQSNTYVTAAITSKWKVYGYEYNAGGFIDGPTQTKPKGFIKNSYFAGSSSTAAAFIAKDCFRDDTSLKIYNSYYDSTLCTNKVFHTNWSCYTINNTTIDCNAYSTAKMGIQSNFVGWDFDNIWTMGDTYPELRRSNFELPDDLLEDLTTEIGESEIVRIVREYSSEEFYAQWEEIWGSDYSEEVKVEKILALATNYGITDPREGLEFVSKSKTKRWAYRNLTTDELYMASNFLNWLEEDGNFEKVLLAIDGLLFNHELEDWVDLKTYVESDYPGVSKYKDMLYDYMDSTSSSIEAWNDVKLVSTLAKNVDSVSESWVEEKIEELNSLDKPGDREARNKIFDEMDKKGVFTYSNLDVDESNNAKFTYVLDETSGFGLYAKAMGNATKTIEIVDIVATDLYDLVALDSKLQTYYQFTTFLNDIVEAKGEVPNELRAAAMQILEEMEEGYWPVIKQIADQLIRETKITEAIRETVLGKLGAETFTAVLTTIKIASWFVNQIVDMGNLVKKEAYVEGYAYLSRLYKKRLESSRENFLNNMSEDNAWEFYYNYNILYSLRYKGEEAYLSMCNLKGVCGKLLSTGYDAKEEAVKETLSLLENSCKFDVGEDVDIPESMEYLSKLVVSCPVDVIVYSPEGDIIAELRDSELKDISNDYGRFAVVYNYYTGDYEKVVCLLDKNVNIEIEAIDDGLVNLEFAYIDENDETKVLNISNTPVLDGDIISLAPEKIVENRIVSLKSENESEELEFKEEDSTYTDLTKASLSETELELFIGENELLTVFVEPQNASIQDMTWCSSDPDVVSVKNGNVKALQEGEAEIYGFLHDYSEPLVCHVTVSEIQEVEAPSASVSSGTYNADQMLILSTGTEDADIYYTMTADGTEPEIPSALSYKYTNAIELKGSVGNSINIRIKAIAIKDRMLDSAVSEFTYTIDIPIPKYAVTVTNGAGSGDYEEGTLVTITADTAPTGMAFKNWTGINGLEIIEGNEKSEIVVFKMPADEVTVSANYEELTESDTEQEEEKPVREVVAPIASILSGTYTSDQRIELSTPTDGADIYYTLTMDGSEPSTPDESSIKYSNAIEVNGQAGSVVQIKIKAIAMKDKMQNSVVSEFTYIIDIPVVKYIITASAGENGYISPSGQVEVEEGSSQTFLITAEEGYEIEEIKVDGTDVAISTAYTFDNVTEDHSIAVTFKKATETPEESVVEAPCITVQPIDVSVKEGEMATFTIKATGTDLVYQWQIDRNDGNGWGNLVTEKAKEASYTTAIINKNCDGFKYRCVVSNSIGSLTSKEVLLTVQDSKIDQEDELTKPEEEIKGSEDSETEEEIIDTEDSETEEEIANTEDSETEEEIVDQEDSETEEEIVEPSENTTESEEEIVNTEESMTEFDKEIIDSEKTTIKSEASMVESEESITDSEKIVGEMGESTMESKESTSEMRESTTESEMSTVDKNNKTSETSTGDKLPMVWLYVLLIVSGVVLTGLGIKKKTMVRR